MESGLFELPAVERGGEVGLPSSVAGAAVEFAAVARLLELGHKVAIPVVDEGVDLVVDYRLRVQVRSCGPLRLRGGVDRWEFEMRAGKKDGRALGGNGSRLRESVADVFLFRARDEGIWWVVPASASSGSRFRISPGGANDSRWRDAWHLFGEL